MSKVKYRYNPKTLTYEEVALNWVDRLMKVASYLIVGAVIATVSVVVAYTFFPTPNEKKLERELAQMDAKYDMLDRRMVQIEKVASDLEYRDDNIYRLIFEAEPIPESVRKGGIGGVNRYREFQGMKDGELIASSARRMDSLAKALYVQSLSFDEVIRLAREKEKMLSHIPAIKPMQRNQIVSGFGYRVHPVYKTQKLHTGLDFSANTGEEIYATGDGVVEVAGSKGNGYGLYVVIDHGYSYKTLYGHMSKVLAKEGQEVKRGDLIGLVGSTGTSVAPHLHYEVWKNNHKIDPINFFYNDLTPEEYEIMRQISAANSQSFD